jgi:Tetracyclin repressor-like, C-terminal domain
VCRLRSSQVSHSTLREPVHILTNSLPDNPTGPGSPEGDVRAILTNVAELLGTARWSSIVPPIVDVAEHDPAFVDIHCRIQRAHAAPLRAALDRAALRGEILLDS